jgi:hypothetical protein
MVIVLCIFYAKKGEIVSEQEKYLKKLINREDNRG